MSERIRDLDNAGLTRDQIADKLGVSRRLVDRALDRGLRFRYALLRWAGDRWELASGNLFMSEHEAARSFPTDGIGKPVVARFHVLKLVMPPHPHASPCPDCGRPNDRPRSICRRCYRERMAEVARRVRQERKRRGMCQICGKRPPKAGMTACDPCMKNKRVIAYGSRKGLP